ncbi:uncharacterized protein [Palaemon carinicauda]|uniref:uncharacterized protein n=1 Tax=Palaemon carinicauda TaxID=392227 RepID=UPI0035B61A44
MEKLTEYDKPLCVPFICYEKPFDSAKTLAAVNSLQRHGIYESYVRTLENVYTGTCQVVVFLKFTLGKHEHQYFRVIYEDLQIIVLSSDSWEQLHKMIKDLNRESRYLGLKMNVSKIKIKFSDYAETTNKCYEPTFNTVNDYMYFRQTASVSQGHETEIKRLSKDGELLVNKMR